MADIEERAERWAKEHLPSFAIDYPTSQVRELVIEAYLAGAAQARHDEYIHRQQGGRL